MINKRKSPWILLIIVIIITGCSRGSVALADESWTFVDLINQGEKTDIIREDVVVRNCGKPENKTITCSAGTSNDLTLTIEGEGSFNIGAGASIGGQISSGLGIGKSSGEELTLELPPPGQIYIYAVSKKYTIKAGQAMVQSSQGEKRKADYIFQAACSLQIETKEPLTCPADEFQAPQEEPSITDTPPVLNIPGEQQEITVTDTPVILPTISLDTPPGSILQEGEYWRQNNISLVLQNVDLYPNLKCVAFEFDLANDSSQDIVLTVVLSQFSVIDNTGRKWKPRALSHYVFCGDPGPWNDSQISSTVGAGKSYYDASYPTWIVSFDGPLTDSQITDLKITVDGLSQLAKATWIVPIGR